MIHSNGSTFAQKTQALKPEHDTPVGLIHPYWARKPLNVIQEIVSIFSEKGDLVIDPFVGSGTTVFAALSRDRKIIASDLNPLSIFLTKTIVSLRQSSKDKLAEASQFIDEISCIALPWYHYRDNLYVERERFGVNGNFEDGDFRLTHSEVVLKALVDGKLRGRTVESPSDSWINKAIPAEFLDSPLNFERLQLLPNSRIAVPKGATLAHYYDKKNQATINFALQLIDSGKFDPDCLDVLRLILSASLPLLRLSDKKASTQWPYWRPKKQLTSRNPIPIMRKKLKAIQLAVSWLEKNFSDDLEERMQDYIQLYNAPVQTLIPKYVSREKADLVVTDPPYADHAPYLEYSSLWIQILGLESPDDAYGFEIVQTDAPARSHDTIEYIKRLQQGLKTCADLVRPGGKLVWFYQDHALEHWEALSEEAVRSGLRIFDIVPLEKQRRSMKTVTSPGKTLDGDLVLVFEKKGAQIHEETSMAQAIQLLRSAIDAQPNTASYFDKYAAIIEIGLKHNLMPLLAQEYSDVRDVLKVIDSGGEHVLAS